LSKTLKKEQLLTEWSKFAEIVQLKIPQKSKKINCSP